MPEEKEEMTRFWKNEMEEQNERMRSSGQCSWFFPAQRVRRRRTNSPSAPSSWTSESDFESDQEHNTWDELIILIHDECSSSTLT